MCSSGCHSGDSPSRQRCRPSGWMSYAEAMDGTLVPLSEVTRPEGAEIGLQVVRAGDGVEVERRHLDKTEALVEPARGLHVVERVEQHAGIARFRGPVHQRLGQQPPEAEAPEGRAHEQPLHLAGIGIVGVGQRPEGAAASHRPIHRRQQHQAARGRIDARQAGELGIETLEIEAHRQAGRVLKQDDADVLPVGGGLGRDQLDVGAGHSRRSVAREVSARIR
mmetsp:Transcript_5510/g.13238  ORF Transcript_5510/g.13238 Transcript_5510/m.13238 type:complete len:222 (-) Transcript_5510:404-1069(-)